MSRFSFGGTGNTPPVVKNLLIINIVMFLALLFFERFMNINLNNILGIYYFESPQFKPWQIVTHMFMHGGFRHILVNMFGLWMFGKTLETVWGSKRFLAFYLITGIGAAFIHELIMFIELAPKIAEFKEYYNVSTLTYERLNSVYMSSNNFDDMIRALFIPTVGASGALYGILLAFGMLFPNTPLFIIPFPVPIKAKWLVLGLGVFALYSGITQPGSSIAHFAHLGGMIFGFILIKLWSKNRSNFY